MPTQSITIPGSKGRIMTQKKISLLTTGSIITNNKTISSRRLSNTESSEIKSLCFSGISSVSPKWNWLRVRDKRLFSKKGWSTLGRCLKKSRVGNINSMRSWFCSVTEKRPMSSSLISIKEKCLPMSINRGLFLYLNLIISKISRNLNASASTYLKMRNISLSSLDKKTSSF